MRSRDLLPSHKCTERTGNHHHDLGFIEYIQLKSGELINNEGFQSAMIFLIILNAIMMGIGTFDFVSDNEEVADVFDIVDDVFLIVFTAEIGLQLMHHGMGVFRDGFSTFDFLIVTSSWLFQPLQVIRALRVIRAVRIISRIKEMKNLTTALLNVIPSLVAIGFVLLLLFYVFGVLFTELFRDLYQQGALDMDYFSRLDKTFFTLFQLMTLDSWSYITKQVMEVYPWAWIPFVTFIMIASFVVINLIIAVLCDAVSELQRNELDAQIQNINPSYSEQRDDTIKILEKKIDNLTVIVENLLVDKARNNI